jgi:hypothetical protein
MSIRDENDADDAVVTKTRVRMEDKTKSLSGRIMRDMVINQGVS